MEKPLRLERQFDLVMSLEVAEHLPVRCARQFVDSLTGLGPVVAFSAAIPQQGGAEHQNEQWPDYWANLFIEKNFVVVDCIRKHIWNNNNVMYWYSQNMLIFVKLDLLKNYPLLEQEFNKNNNKMLSIVHPKHYLLSTSNKNLTLRQVISLMPILISKSISYRFDSTLNYFRKIIK